MSSRSSVSLWIDEIVVGNDDAAQKLWDRYFPDLLRVARIRLQQIPRKVTDEEDVALSALNSFFNAAKKGRFDDVADSDSLWRLLSTMTQRKAVNAIRRYLAKKRGQGDVIGESQLEQAGFAGRELERFADAELGPELTVIVSEQCRLLLDSLRDKQLRQIALARMDGYTNEEIAINMDLALRTVERRVQLIRTTWNSFKESDRESF